MIAEITENENQEWRSCCMRMDKTAVKYFVQVGILSGLICFSSVMLITDKDCNSQRNYSALLMICLGVFLPAPHI
jgi:fluoride ion exporter CrcB/FEX